MSKPRAHRSPFFRTSAAEGGPVDFTHESPLVFSWLSDGLQDEDPHGATPMPDRAYVLINVLPGQTSHVVKALSQIKEIKIIDPCWGKPDLFTVVEVSDQEALSALVLTKIHAIEGVAQTDTHLVYRLQKNGGS
jgi:DNA-binding Lrp family transcriptional regulator